MRVFAHACKKLHQIRGINYGNINNGMIAKQAVQVSMPK